MSDTSIKELRLHLSKFPRLGLHNETLRSTREGMRNLRYFIDYQSSRLKIRSCMILPIVWLDRLCAW